MPLVRLRRSRAVDTLVPIDLEQKQALAKHASGVTRSQDDVDPKSMTHADIKREVQQIVKEQGTKGREYGQARLQVLVKESNSRDWALERKNQVKGNDMRTQDVMAEEIRAKLGISEADWGKLSKPERISKAQEFLRKGKASDAEPHKFEPMPGSGKLCNRCLEGKTHSNHTAAAKDTLAPIPIKQSGATVMPTELDGKPRYATDADRAITQSDLNDAARGLRMLSASPDDLRGMIKEHEGKDVFMSKVIVQSAKQMLGTKLRNGATDRKRAADSVTAATPDAHLQRAMEYEVGQDKARALDSYRTAASGFRRTGDKAKEAQARDGINACVASIATHYAHPGAGRVRVCDSAATALRTAVERTRAGEVVQIIDSKTVRPGRVAGRARAKDTEAVKCWECGERFPSSTTEYPFHQTASGKKCKMSGKKVTAATAEDRKRGKATDRRLEPV